MTESAVTITLLHSNDIHSHLEAASQITGYFGEIRRRVPEDRLLVVDCGDFLDRVRMETEGTHGAVNRALLEHAGYDAVLMGNNEGLTYTPEQLNDLFDGMQIPVVCANMTLADSGAAPDWMTPTLTLEKSGVKIGLIGVTAPFNDYYRLLGWEASDPLIAAKNGVERLRAQVDVLIVLSHLGLRFDERLAAEVDGIDLILGGHTHHLLMSPLRVGKTAICAAGKYGQYVGHLELNVDPTAGRVEVYGGCLATDEMPLDPDACAIIEAHREEARLKMSREIARLSHPLAWEPYTESPLANLLASAVRQTTGAEIGLINAGQLLDGLDEGAVTEHMIHALCPSPINPVAIKLRGDQIVRALEESLLPEFYELEIRGFGFRGRVLGTLCVDGMEFVVDPSKPPMNKIASVQINGESLDRERIYAVGTLDMFTFGVGYVGLKEGAEPRYFLPQFIRHSLSEALNDAALVSACANPRRHLRA